MRTPAASKAAAPLAPEPVTAPESSSTLAASAQKNILALIRSGELAPGAAVNEVDLARRFGMSRGPIREAIKSLEARKLVARAPYQMARVVKLDQSEIRQIFELRECLEGMACRLATRIMSDAELAQLSARVENARTPANYSFVFTDYAFNFHETIVRSCGNSRIQAALQPEIYDQVRLYRWSKGTPPASHGPSTREHWQIARAMSQRDEDLAESLMRSHIQRVMQLVDS